MPKIAKFFYRLYSFEWLVVKSKGIFFIYLVFVYLVWDVYQQFKLDFSHHFTYIYTVLQLRFILIYVSVWLLENEAFHFSLLITKRFGLTRNWTWDLLCQWWGCYLCANLTCLWGGGILNINNPFTCLWAYNGHQVHFFEIPAKMRDIDGAIIHFLAMYLNKRMVERGDRTHAYYE